MKIQFRENFKTRKVEVRENGVKVVERSEYLAAAEWAKAKYSLSDHDLMQIYADYRVDYDS